MAIRTPNFLQGAGVRRRWADGISKPAAAVAREQFTDEQIDEEFTEAIS